MSIKVTNAKIADLLEKKQEAEYKHLCYGEKGSLGLYRFYAKKLKQALAEDGQNVPDHEIFTVEDDQELMRVMGWKVPAGSLEDIL